jgi:Na+/phosphate symporter
LSIRFAASRFFLASMSSIAIDRSMSTCVAPTFTVILNSSRACAICFMALQAMGRSSREIAVVFWQRRCF